jgi:membrane-anchored glycerophosphoryl diester phosphodiesterase (GDPDase)
MFDLDVVSSALCDVRLVLVLPVLVMVLVRLMVELASRQTWKTTMSNIVELVRGTRDRNSVTEVLLEQLRCGVRCDNLEC